MKKLLFKLFVLFGVLIPFTALASCNTNSVDYGTAGTASAKVANNLGIDNGSISVGFWIKLADDVPANNTWVLWNKQSGTNFVEYKIRYVDVSGTKTIKFQREKGNSTIDSSNYVKTIGTGTWHRIWFTYDGANINGYYDGSLVTGPTAASGNGSGSSINAFAINSNNGDASGNAHAKWDDVQVYSSALSSGTISTDFTSPVEISCSTANLVAYYKFDADTTTDCTTNAFNFTNTGSPVQSTDIPFGACTTAVLNDDDYMQWFMSLFQ